MNSVFKLTAAALLGVTLAGCDQGAPTEEEQRADQLENTADAVRDEAEQTADIIEDRADGMSSGTEENMENRADQVREQGEQQADALEQDADRLEDAPQ
jgi:hypothetical protein